MYGKSQFVWIWSRTLTAVAVLLIWGLAQAATPVVSNIRASQRAGTKLVDVYYDVSDADGDILTVELAVSSDAGLTWNIPAQTFSGDVGAGVAPGANRRAVWNAGTDFSGNFIQNCKIRVTAHDNRTPPAPAGMAYIPEGLFQMGDSLLEIGDDSRPVHNVYVDGFFMDKNLVSRELWIDVRTWAVANGYQFDNSGTFRDVNHPVYRINWYDAVKWCNARSQKAGLTPVYCTDSNLSVVYLSGQLNISNDCVRWTANGYRLPTEAEWEKAARGGLTGSRFPWGDTISHTQASYYSSSGVSCDVSSTKGYHPIWGSNTSPQGYFTPNGYGLYDMAGNLFQWVWDWKISTYYGLSEANNNPHGPPSNNSSGRVLRGGNWEIYSAFSLRCSYRASSSPNENSYISVTTIGGGGATGAFGYRGFRCARGKL